MLYHEIINKLEGTSGRLDKEDILKTALSQDVCGSLAAGLELALSSLVTFGIKQVPVAEQNSLGEIYDILPFQNFNEAVQKLVSREATGHDARDLVVGLMHSCHPNVWNYWYRRILIKDLRCGVDIKTVNKVLKSLSKAEIPVFECQLAHDSAKHEGKMVGKKLLSVKLDGIRLLSIVYPDGKVEQFSRNGKEMLNFDKIRDQLGMFPIISPSLIKEPVVLDGEVMSKSFQDLMKQARRKENVETDDARLFLFDLIPLKDFLAGYNSTSQYERSLRLKELVCAVKSVVHPFHNIKALEQEFVDLGTQSGQEIFKQMNRVAIAEGYEGLMLKDPEAPYECKRSTSWLKLKPFIEVSLTIKAFEEGTGKNVGSLGAMLCEGEEDGKLLRVSVGGGFSEAQRLDFWLKREELVNHVVEIRADAITKNQDEKNEYYSMRFPRFLRFRGFSVEEKI